MVGRRGRLIGLGLYSMLVACGGGGGGGDNGGDSGAGDVSIPTGEDGGAGADTGASGGGDATVDDAGPGTNGDATTGEQDASDATVNGGDSSTADSSTTDSSAVDASTVDSATDSSVSDGSTDAGSASATLDQSAITFGLANCGGAAPSNQSLKITNDGGVTLTVQAAVGTTSFTVTPSNTTVAPHSSATLTLTAVAVPTSATAGTAITDTLTVTTNDPAHKTSTLPVSVIPQGVTLALAPTTAAFGLDQEGVAATPIPLKLSNTGNVSTTVTLTQPANAEYGIAPTTSFAVAPGTPATVTASFTPNTTTATSTSAALTLAAGTYVCGTSVSSVPMSGQGALGSLTVSSTDMEFGTSGLWPCDGTAPPSQTVTIGNSGTSAFNVTSLALAGTSSAAYSISLPAGVTLPASVPAKGSLVVTVNAPSIPSPTAVPGNYDDTLTITTDLPSSGTEGVALNLGASGAVLGFDQTGISFPSVTSGTTTNATFHVLNTGNAPANVTLTASTTGGGNLFAVSPTTSFAVAGGGGGPAQASFSAPTDTNPHAGTISLAVGASDVVCQPLPAALSLSGTAQNGGVSLSSNAVSFGTNGNVSCGTQAPAQTVTLTNSGNTTENWWSALGLGGASPYQVTPACTQASPCAIAPGAANAVTISIQPAAISATAGMASFNDTLTVSSSAVGDAGHAITLTEQSFGAILAFNPTGVAFGATSYGTTTPSSVALQNTGNAPVSVGLTESGSAEFGLSGSSVNVGTSTPGSFSVTFTPGLSSATANGTVSLVPPANSLCAAAPTLSLSGSGGYNCDGGVCQTPPANCAAVLAANSSAPSGLYTIAPGGTVMTAYCDMVDQGGGWTQVLDDDTTVSPFYPTKAQWAGPYNSGSPNSGQYSIVNMLAAIHSGTNYTFLNVYPLLSGYEQWTQVQNPTSITGTLPTLVGVVNESPASQVAQTCDGLSFGGLYLSNDPTYLSGDQNPGCYWFAVGETGQYGAGIPTYNNLTTTRETLYVR